MKKTMLLISCCSLAILLSVSNVTAGDEGDKKDPSLYTFLKKKAIGTIEKTGEYSKNAAQFYGAYIICRLATDYVILPIYKKITALNEKETCSCEEEEKVKSEQQPPVAKGGWVIFPYPRRA